MADLPIVADIWPEAVDRIAGKTPVGARLNSAEWARVPLAIRERAIWSATLEEARAVQGLKDDLQLLLSGQTADGRTVDRSRIVERMRARLGAMPGDTGELTDLTSFKRLELIIDFQVQDAYGYARWRQDLADPDVLDALPAYRFTRIEARDEERQDWPQRWAGAFHQVQGRGAVMGDWVALKTSPIWARLSRFGRPWPPFDYGSGMGLEEVDRFEAEALGLLREGEPVDGPQGIRDFNDEVEASLNGLDTETRGWLEDALGPLGRIEGDRVQLPAPEPAPSPTRRRRRNNKPLDNTRTRRALETADYVDEQALGGGINTTVKLANGKKVVFKPAEGESSSERHGREGVPDGQQYLREAAASIVDDWLGTGLVPPTTVLNYKGQVGSAQLFRTGYRAAIDYAKANQIRRMNDLLGQVPEPVRRRWHLFDHVLGHTDRHVGNWMVRRAGGGLRVSLIDNGLSLSETGDTWMRIAPAAGLPLAPEDTQALERFLAHSTQIEEDLRPFLDQDAIDFMFTRAADAFAWQRFPR